MKTVFLESHHINNLFFGLGQFNYQLISALQKEDHPDLRLVIHGANLPFLRESFGAEAAYKKYFSWRRYPAFRIRTKYDLWHSMNQNTRIEPHSQKMPYVLTVHNILQIDPHNKQLLAKNKAFQDKLSRSQAITYISEHAKQSTHEHYQVPSVPEFIIYNGNPIDKIAIEPNYQPSFSPAAPFLFTIGEITERKNFISLIYMLQHLPKYALVIAGKNTTKAAAEIMSTAEKIGCADRVYLLGKIGNQEKQYYYKHCLAFVFPSLREGFGLPVIEAMRFGKPVFLSNLTALPEIGGELAYYWDHFDPKYMAEHLQTGLAQFEADQTLSERLVQRALSFSWENAAKQYLAVYRSLL